jgi:hypothetical protein
MTSSAPRHARRSGRRVSAFRVVGVLCLFAVVTAAGVAGSVWWHHRHDTPAASLRSAAGVHRSVGVAHSRPPGQHAPPQARTTSLPTTTEPTGTSPVTLGPLTSPPLPKPARDLLAGHVTAVGDSVMLDYQDPLQQDIPGIAVYAAVSRQWYVGEEVLSELRLTGQLGAIVVIALGTNGPITDSDFDAMMSVVSGASRVVIVTTHVDQPWQDQVNEVLESGAARYKNVVIADWQTLADENPGWLYSDETHLPIDGTGADALAALIASKV